MELMNAQTAREDTKRALIEKNDKFLGDITMKIHSAVKDGRYQIIVPDADMCDGALNILKEHGYNVAYNYRDSEYIIRW